VTSGEDVSSGDEDDDDMTTLERGKRIAKSIGELSLELTHYFSGVKRVMEFISFQKYFSANAFIFLSHLYTTALLRFP
jgi:hypothetical protein